MVVLPTGRFRMGDLSGEGYDNERPVRTVTLHRPIAMGKYPVTFEDYDRYVSAANADRPDDKGWGRGTRPVIEVSQEDAKAYAVWLSEQTGKPYRLPSEAEWEYAARAGTTSKYSWGDEIDRNRANCDGCGSEWDDEKRPRWGVLRPMPLVCTTCTAMSGSGWRTAGTRATKTRRAMAAPGRRAATKRGPLCAAAPGSIARGGCVARAASGLRRRIVAAVSVFGWSGILPLDSCPAGLSAVGRRSRRNFFRAPYGLPAGRLD